LGEKTPNFRGGETGEQEETKSSIQRQNNIKSVPGAAVLILVVTTGAPLIPPGGAGALIGAPHLDRESGGKVRVISVLITGRERLDPAVTVPGGHHDG
jgi:hypothetical protein